MMMLLVTILFLAFSAGEFVGIFLFGVMFIFLSGGFYLLGVDMMKGDFYGVVGLDYISFYMVMLMLWLFSLVLVLFYSDILWFLVLGLLVSMGGMFISLDLVYLFIYFEFSMIPMFMLIMFLGGSKERYGASLYMLIYTMFSSLPMLIMLVMLMGWSGGLNMDYLFYGGLDLDLWVVMVLVIMFLVKVPMFMVHIWLPKAHVEAPVYGSMILASVMLKMGGYGVIRCMSFVMVDLLVSDFFFCLCLCGCLMISYSCMYQVDLKVLVAYSSIVHMGMMLMGIFSGWDMGFKGGLVMMLSHGVCSSGMFYLVNEIYSVSGSRLLMLNKGLLGVSPILSFMWGIMLIDNLGVPPCFGILGELMLIGGSLGYSWYLFVLFFFFIFFVSCFVMNMYGLLVGGLFMFKLGNVCLSSYYGVVMHLMPLNLLIFFIGICL